VLPWRRIAVVFAVWVCLTIALWAYGEEFGVALGLAFVGTALLDFIIGLISGAWWLSKDVYALSRWIARLFRRPKP